MKRFKKVTGYDESYPPVQVRTNAVEPMTPTEEIEKRLEEGEDTRGNFQSRADIRFLLQALRTAEQALAEATRENERLREAYDALLAEHGQTEQIRGEQAYLLERQSLKGDPNAK